MARPSRLATEYPAGPASNAMDAALSVLLRAQCCTHRLAPGRLPRSAAALGHALAASSSARMIDVALCTLWHAQRRIHHPAAPPRSAHALPPARPRPGLAHGQLPGPPSLSPLGPHRPRLALGSVGRAPVPEPSWATSASSGSGFSCPGLRPLSPLGSRQPRLAHGQLPALPPLSPVGSRQPRLALVLRGVGVEGEGLELVGGGAEGVAFGVGEDLGRGDREHLGAAAAL
jgi:hypothetical protein